MIHLQALCVVDSKGRVTQLNLTHLVVLPSPLLFQIPVQQNTPNPHTLNLQITLNPL